MKPRHSLLCFPAAEYMRNGINSAIKECERCPSFIVIDLRNVQELDYTAAKGIGGLKKELAARHITLLILGSNEDIKLVLKASLKAQNVLQVDNESELDITMQEQKSNDKMELKDVIAPLLVQKDEDDISVIRKESLRRE
jgi:sodium-independent sulfate anion transporter 11